MTASILTLSVPHDAHAHCVEWALRERGIAYANWYQTDFPVRDRLSLHIGERGLSTTVDALAETPATTVWARRFGRVHLGDNVHPDDAEVARQECVRFLNGLRHNIALDAFWINPYHTESYSNSKPVQLRLAQKCGLTVPETLMSNDIEAVRAFCTRHGRVIYKTFFPAQWQAQESIASTFATVLRPEHLEDPDAFQFCPGIYQPLVEKAYEARVMVMGQTVVAGKLIARKARAEIDDWRHSQIQAGEGVKVEPLELSAPLQQACVRLLGELGIVFGCMDFIIDRDGNWHFLEVNPMGQFLWVEQDCPDIPMLEAFCNFLVHGGADFRLAEHTVLSGLRLADVFDNLDYRRWYDTVQSAHVKPYHPDLTSA